MRVVEILKKEGFSDAMIHDLLLDELTQEVIKAVDKVLVDINKEEVEDYIIPIRVEKVFNNLYVFEGTQDSNELDIQKLKNEEEIDDLKSLVEGQSIASIQKDKYIEGLEKCILNQREEIKQLQEELEELEEQAEEKYPVTYKESTECVYKSDKDKEIEQLNNIIESQEEQIADLQDEIEEYEEEIEHNDIEKTYLKSVIKRQDKLIGKLHFKLNEK